MNELNELGLAEQSVQQDQDGGSDLIELGAVVSQTKAHGHGTLWDGIFPTTSP
ncbi:hypothetical protein [Xanthomonas campestris]|uniref:hypothetical protein n=1 Tax=Xanthomonas campestris TaxID=339 RepID=UPI0013904E7F|nr:hypothetical protein [Xanthomonas campestris]MCF8826460.1 hypothetical protein [Xanthomonas campestris pv. raphani]MEA9838941.1 hypothetical protein [Xanthomonas campestris pv. raphani]MEA9878469.1 hypothetical protein [Xanthomonas campestris pv. raphani]MEA9894888.1 hypothetical protein [Xanthomonas campestris pv. raphani]MEA9934530.1 hypothetical protein [Xanthomonas campestris pv. raphani]